VDARHPFLPLPELRMIFRIKRFLSSMATRIGALFVLGFVAVVFLYRRVMAAQANSLVSVHRAKAEIALFKAEKAAEDGEEKALAEVRKEHDQKMKKISEKARRITEAAGDSRAALAAALNRSFGK